MKKVEIENKKIVLLFPGQGSQFIGMGKWLYQISPEIFEQANKTLGYSLTELMFNGPDKQLTLTENTQPAILTHSVALWNYIKDRIPKEQIVFCLGHSVGEYAALVSSGALEFSEAVSLVHQRGKAMQKAVPSGLGAMAAILKVPVDYIQKTCEEISEADSLVSIANLNTPEQIVVSGHSSAVERLKNHFEKNYTDPFRFVPLNVSAPFHSSLMKQATQTMSPLLNNTNFNSLNFPYIANIDAQVYHIQTSSDQLKENLIHQIEGNVKWFESFNNTPEDAIYLEVGPGKTLTGMMRRINRQFKTYALDPLFDSDTDHTEIL